MAKFKHFGTIEVNGQEYKWNVKHYGGASTAHENQRGLAVRICIEDGRYKELVIEFPFTDYFFEAPKSQTDFEHRLCSCIQSAIEAGWRPMSRGKAYYYKAPKETEQSSRPDW